MRTVLFIALGTLAAFIAGLAGTYFVLPMVAPDIVEAQQADSLATDGLTADHLTGDGSAGDGFAVTDSLLAAAPLPLDSTGVAPSDTSFASGDSLEALRRQIAEYEAQISAFEAKIDAAQARRAQASELASTLIKLEDRELSRVLDQLDFDVLEILYAEASARDRARMLGALDPARTAVFIRRATAPRVPTALANEAEPAEPAEPDVDASTPR